MKFTIVGNRDGHASIHWPGVVLAALLMAAVYGAGVVAFSLALGWFSAGSFAALPMVLGIMLGIGIKRGLRMPPQDLPRIG